MCSLLLCGVNPLISVWLYHGYCYSNPGVHGGVAVYFCCFLPSLFGRLHDPYRVTSE